MKKTLFTIQLLLSSAVVCPLSALTLPAHQMVAVLAADNPISQAEDFESGNIVSSTADGEYKWYRYKVNAKKAYRLKLGYNSKAKVKMTADANADVSKLADVELTKDQTLWAQITPTCIVNAGEYLYFAISSPTSTVVEVIQEEITYTYHFGEAKATPDPGSEIESFTDIVISYPDAATNNTDARIALTMDNSGTSSTNGEAMIPAQIYPGKLEAVHGTEPLGTAGILLTTDENGKAELRLKSELEVTSGEWYTIQIPDNVLSYCTPLFAGMDILTPIQGVAATPGMLLHYKGMTLQLSSTGVGITANDTLKVIGLVPFGFNKEVKATEGAVMELRTDGKTVKTAELTVLNAGGRSTVLGNFGDETLTPFTLQDSTAYTLVLPAKSVETLNGALPNEEVSVAFSGPVYKADTVKVEVPVPVEAEMVNFTCVMGDRVTTASTAPKDKPIKVEIVPEEGWKVATLTLNDLNVLPDLHGTTYQSPDLYKNSTLTATFAYDGILFEEDATGLAQVENTSLKAYSRDGKIVVEGLKQGEVVKVYSVGGSLLSQTTVEHSRLSISLPTGQVYIVKAGNHALKLSNK